MPFDTWDPTDPTGQAPDVPFDRTKYVPYNPGPPAVEVVTLPEALGWELFQLATREQDMRFVMEGRP